MAKSPVAKRLKEARLAAGLSQKSLGIAAGIDEFSASARMNQYETGKHVPDYLTLALIAKVLKLPVAYFYADNQELASFIKLFNSLSKNEKETIFNQANK
jgi:transcriptional regulator with XRE-family HTH domain